MTTNQEWLFSLTLKEYLEWMESEHSEPNPDCSAMLYRMFTENVKHEPCRDYEPKDDVDGYGADFNVAEPNFDNIEAVEMDASRFEAVEMDASRLVAREPDSREKLESDMREWWRVGLPGIQEKAENVINYNEAIKWLDRQAEITREEADAGCKECFTERHKRERELGEAIDGLTEQVELERRKEIELAAERDQLKNAINELQKKQPYCYDPEQPLDSLNTIGRYIDELKSYVRNLVNDLIRTSDERDNLKANNLQLHTLAGEQAATIDELTAERNELQTRVHKLTTDLFRTDADCERYKAKVADLYKELYKHKRYREKLDKCDSGATDSYTE